MDVVPYLRLYNTTLGTFFMWTLRELIVSSPEYGYNLMTVYVYVNKQN